MQQLLIKLEDIKSKNKTNYGIIEKKHDFGSAEKTKGEKLKSKSELCVKEEVCSIKRSKECMKLLRYINDLANQLEKKKESLNNLIDSERELMILQNDGYMDYSDTSSLSDTFASNDSNPFAQTSNSSCYRNSISTDNNINQIPEIVLPPKKQDIIKKKNEDKPNLYKRSIMKNFIEGNAEYFKFGKELTSEQITEDKNGFKTVRHYTRTSTFENLDFTSINDKLVEALEINPLITPNSIRSNKYGSFHNHFHKRKSHFSTPESSNSHLMKNQKSKSLDHTRNIWPLEFPLVSKLECEKKNISLEDEFLYCELEDDPRELQSLIFDYELDPLQYTYVENLKRSQSMIITETEKLRGEKCKVFSFKTKAYFK